MAREPKEAPNVAGARGADQPSPGGTGSDRATNKPAEPGSGKRFALSEPTDRAKVRNPSKERGQTARMSAEFVLPPPPPLGRVMDRPAEVGPVQEYQPQPTVPFGSEPQGLDPATGNVIPVSPEMLRTGSDEETSVQRERRERSA